MKIMYKWKEEKNTLICFSNEDNVNDNFFDFEDGIYDKINNKEFTN